LTCALQARHTCSNVRPQSAPPSSADPSPAFTAKPAAAAAESKVALSNLLGNQAVAAPSQPAGQPSAASLAVAVPSKQVEATPVKGLQGSVGVAAASSAFAAAPRRVSSEVQTDDGECGFFGIETPFKSSGTSHPSKGSPTSGSSSQPYNGSPTRGGSSGSTQLVSLPCNPDLPPRPPSKGPRPASMSRGTSTGLPDPIAHVLSLDKWVSKQPAGEGEGQSDSPGDAGGLLSWLCSHSPLKASSGIARPSAEVGAGAGLFLGPLEALQFSDSEEEEAEVLLGGGQALHGSTTALAALARSPQATLAKPMRPSALLPPSPPASAKSSDSSFNRVFFAPWSAVSDAATQTGTAAGERASVGAGGRTLAGATADPASAHFEVFLQHFTASLPHLAMSLADLHSAHGGASTIFGKAQFYMKQCLQIKDELSELLERHRETSP
jgi:hypothetical protein